MCMDQEQWATDSVKLVLRILCYHQSCSEGIFLKYNSQVIKLASSFELPSAHRLMRVMSISEILC